jgi:hypothetical protein
LQETRSAVQALYPKPREDEEFHKSCHFCVGLGKRGKFHSVDIQSGRTAGTSPCVQTLRCVAIVTRRRDGELEDNRVRVRAAVCFLAGVAKLFEDTLSGSFRQSFPAWLLPAAECMTVGGRWEAREQYPLRFFEACTSDYS